jgi:hypothetical protein
MSATLRIPRRSFSVKKSPELVCQSRTVCQSVLTPLIVVRQFVPPAST